MTRPTTPPLGRGGLLLVVGVLAGLLVLPVAIGDDLREAPQPPSLDDPDVDAPHWVLLQSGDLLLGEVLSLDQHTLRLRQRRRFTTQVPRQRVRMLGFDARDRVRPPVTGLALPGGPEAEGAPDLGLVVEDAPGDGVRVSALVLDGPAARAGVQVGDVILRVRNLPVEDPDDLAQHLAASRPGDLLPVVVMRGDTSQVFPVLVGSATAAPVAPQEPAAPDQP